MFARILSLFKHRRHSSKSSQGTADRDSSATRQQSRDPLAALSELAIPSPIQNRKDAAVYTHHTLEENLRKISHGDDPDAEDQEDILVRHHTLQENLELAKELSQEIRRQSEELRRPSRNDEEF